MGLIAHSCPVLHIVGFVWVRQFDAYGNFIGRVRTCNYY